MTAPAADASPLDAFLAFDLQLAHEDLAGFEALRQHMLDDLRPEGPIERIWTDEIIDLTWQRRQLARLRAHILATARATLLWQVVAGHLGCATEAAKRMSALRKRYERRDPDAVAHVEGLLAAKGHDMAFVAAQAHRTALPELAQVETLTAALERRRERLLREVERHQIFAARVRATVQRFEQMPSTSDPDGDDRLKRPPSAADIARGLKERPH